LHVRDSHDLPHISSGERFTSRGSADWIRACCEGFLSKTELDQDDLEIGTIVTNAAHAERFAIRCAEGQLKGTGAMTCRFGVALLFADSTRPKYRGQRVQSALISSRLAHARVAGCDLAMSVVEPGSQSERNYLRFGFRRMYRRLTLQQTD
jgi:GNAT superfamily N-acetyltransferase